MAIKLKDVKVLWAKSGNRCAICFKSLTHESEDVSAVGEQAHIKGENSGKSKQPSARYDKLQSEDERNSYANLVLLCPTCHTIIDKNEAEYTVERLHIIKDEHERKIADSIKKQTLNVTFYELEHTLRHLIRNQPTAADEDLELITPKDKIKKNELSPTVERLIQAGLLGAVQVEAFLNENADMDYSENLRSAFVKSYQQLKNEGQKGDDLFFSLLNVATNNNSDSRYMAAGLNVLVYYFQLCEVFEK